MAMFMPKSFLTSLKLKSCLLLEGRLNLEQISTLMDGTPTMPWLFMATITRR